MLAMMGTQQLAVVLLQLKAVVPTQRERAIRRARREGYFEVRLLK